MWPFGRSSSASSKTSAPSWREATGDAEVYNEVLPPSMPVVRETIDSLAKLAVSQRVFIVDHVTKVKLELLKEEPTPEKSGAWFLNGFALEDEDAVDFVRACPDALSNLTFVPFDGQATLWTRISSWLSFDPSSSQKRNLNVVDDLGYVLTIAEVVEIAGHLLAAVSYAMAEAVPKPGSPTRRELAFELASSGHRGSSHAVYLISDIVHSAERIASRSDAASLRVASTLFIYKPLLLGGLTGVAVNVSGAAVDDLPVADVDRDELRDLLSKKGRFVSSSTSDFVLDPSMPVTPQRAATVAVSSCQKLVDGANRALSSFFANEALEFQIEREQERARAAEILEQERVEEELRTREAREVQEQQALAREEAEQRQPQRVSAFQNDYGYYDEDSDDEYDEFANYAKLDNYSKFYRH